MKKINDFEEQFKNKLNTLMIFDYDGTVTSTEPTINSPFSNSLFKRILENFTRKDYVKIIILTNREIKNFKKEFGLELDTIELYEYSNNIFKDINDKQIATKENIISHISSENPMYKCIYIGDDKLLIKKIKKIDGYAIGILPICEESEKNVNFSIEQKKFEETLITINNLYL